MSVKREPRLLPAVDWRQLIRWPGRCKSRLARLGLHQGCLRTVPTVILQLHASVGRAQGSKLQCCGALLNVTCLPCCRALRRATRKAWWGRLWFKATIFFKRQVCSSAAVSFASACSHGLEQQAAQPQTAGSHSFLISAAMTGRK